MGNIIASSNGRAVFRIIDKHIKLAEIIGRSLGITAQADDLGRGTHENSIKDGNSGERYNHNVFFKNGIFTILKKICRIGCGIIARSAGILGNTKKVCFCSGRTLWEEKAYLSSDHTSPKLMT